MLYIEVWVVVKEEGVPDRKPEHVRKDKNAVTTCISVICWGGGGGKYLISKGFWKGGGEGM
jgi:hypothetical protein